MSRLRTRLQMLRQERRKALIGYIVAGDPSKESTVEFMHAMVEGGVNVIELGVPFTDPVADGPVIQAACERALKGGMRLHDVFDAVRLFRERDEDTPVVLMGYLNPLEATGYASFAGRASKAGVDGLLIVDLPAEEAGELSATLAAADIELVGLVAPTTAPMRLDRICRSATGFVYYVSLSGVTGAGAVDRTEMADQIGRIRAQTDCPVGVGFGISDAETAVHVAKSADAVIIGSALVRHIAEHGANAGPAIRGALAEIRKALDRNIAA